MLPAYAPGNSRNITLNLDDNPRILPPLSRNIVPPLKSGDLVEVEGAGICFRWTKYHVTPKRVLERRRVGGE
jgi:hypothetical protein